MQVLLIAEAQVHFCINSTFISLKVLLQMKVSFNVLMFFHSISLNSKYPPLNKYECPLLFVFAFGKDVLKMSISPG